jgi:hypothetical protein
MARPVPLILADGGTGPHHPIRIMLPVPNCRGCRSPARVGDVRLVTKMSALRRPSGRYMNEPGVRPMAKKKDKKKDKDKRSKKKNKKK